MQEDLYIFGFGEFAAIAFEYFTYDSNFNVKGFIVDEEFSEFLNDDIPFKPIKKSTFLNTVNPESCKIFVAIPASNLNRDRERNYLFFKNLGFNFASYISSRAFIWRNVEIGENTFIFENNVLQPFVSVGNNVVMWSGNHVGHRSKIADHVFVTSHVVISGYCDIGHHSFLGVNATLNDGVKVSENCIIGANAHLVRDTEANLVYIGAPAKIMPGKSSHDVKL